LSLLKTLWIHVMKKLPWRSREISQTGTDHPN
jgi:hypothetical protein